ncbi:hypothetical protein M8C21_028455, partial [Ambrosia artemisiifolia]
MIQHKQPKMKAKRVSKAQRVDIITTLPQAIIETILCLLPIEEAARTSVLSKEWRYKWTTLPKLEFYEDDVKLLSGTSSISDLESARKNMDTRCKLFYTIHQVLLLRQGPIHDFTLLMDAHRSCYEIDQILLHLSRNHAVKKLRFEFEDYNTYALPLSFFSLHHLTDLYLENCNIDQKPIFNGFANLTNLSFICGKISGKALQHLLSNCPSLKSLYLQILEEDFLGSEYPSIMELFKCLPMIEDLTIWGDTILPLVKASLPQELPASLLHLKYCIIQQMCFVDGYRLPFLAVLMKCSPNLEKIELQIDDSDRDMVMLEEDSVTLEEFSNVWLEHLNVLEIEYFTHVKLVLELVKFILARSPSLKK